MKAPHPEARLQDTVEYTPIACGLHDELEALAVRREPCCIRYHDPAGETLEALGRIEDVYARGGVEYLRVEGGVVVPLDRLQQIQTERGSLQFGDKE